MRVLNIIRKDGPRNFLSDLYYHLMNMSWGPFLFLFLILFILLNICFALLYTAFPSSTTGDGSFLSNLFFSVHTLSTVGYGNISPNGLIGNLISTIEIFTGMLSLAIMTGLIFSKFSIPKSQILFSKNLLLTKYNGVDHLMLRVANVRSNRIMNAKAGMTLLRNEVSPEGISLRKMHNLKLVRTETPIFSLSLTIMHPIDSSSPLYGISSEEILGHQFGLTASLSGLDETIGQSISASNFYTVEDLVINRQFKDILETTKHGDTVIHLDRFHEFK
ncbi:ion channel [Bacteriovorax sp. DB6_IX]|uniref:ion channel n=1 Tax=Bacteriovorax sp. DB6_IX TaxID=1353530 RepID=UPI00038A0E36|nr:ion channel [Bacteriovorax sp. DB6_IX]EQC51170.1 inward rectifier potassium channel [Bacteriovorax sp. DB6_IX]